MIAVYFAEKHTNTFDLLPFIDHSEYHSDWCCDLCYSQNYESDFKTIISTQRQYYRVCSDCIYTKRFEIWWVVDPP
jgi:hypothetical protein